jgi:hypothetical protein
MRRFTGPDGTDWDVVIGRESWGTICALFVPVRTGAAVRQAVLRVSSTDAAELLLDEMDEASLSELLSSSTLKQS